MKEKPTVAVISVHVCMALLLLANLPHTLSAQLTPKTAPARQGKSTPVQALDVVRTAILWHQLQGTEISNLELSIVHNKDLGVLDEFERRRAQQSLRANLARLQKEISAKGAIFASTVELALSEYDFSAKAFHINFTPGPAAAVSLDLQGVLRVGQAGDGRLRIAPFLGAHRLEHDTGHGVVWRQDRLVSRSEAGDLEENLKVSYVAPMDTDLAPEVMDIQMSESDAEKLMKRFQDVRKVEVTFFLEALGAGEEASGWYSSQWDQGGAFQSHTYRTINVRLRKIVFALPAMAKQYRSLADAWLAQAEMYDKALKGQKGKSSERYLTPEFKRRLLKVWEPRDLASQADSSHQEAEADSQTQPKASTRKAFSGFSETADCAREASTRSIEGSTKKDLVFRNKLKEPVKVYWLTHEGKRKFYFTLTPGREMVQHTYVTHPWVITNEADHCLMLIPNQTPGDELVQIGAP